MKIWENRSTKEIQTLETYLFYTCRNKAISVIRKAKFTDFQEELISNLSHVPKVEQELGFMDLKQKIENVTDYLPPRCKEIFHMSKFDQLSRSGAAERVSGMERKKWGYFKTLCREAHSPEYNAGECAERG